MRGISIGAGITVTKIWIPSKGFVKSSKLSTEEIKNLRILFSI